MMSSENRFTLFGIMLWEETMRQRSLNGVLAGAVGVVFCLLAASAYLEIGQANLVNTCVSPDRITGTVAGRCENCPAMPCVNEQRRQALTPPQQGGRQAIVVGNLNRADREIAAGDSGPA